MHCDCIAYDKHSCAMQSDALLMISIVVQRIGIKLFMMIIEAQSIGIALLMISIIVQCIGCNALELNCL